MMGRVFHRGLITFLGAMSALSVVSSQVEPQVMGCNQQLQTYISTQTNLTLAAIKQFKLNYAWDKFDLGWDDVNAIMDETQDLELFQVCNEQNTCQRVLPKLPTIPSTPAKASQQMAEMLEFTRHYAYAVEILFLDQCLHEDSFQQHVHEISRQLDSLISAMIYGSKQWGVTIRDANIRNLIDKVYRGANTALRDQNAIRTIRQCYMGLHYILQFYSLNDTHPLLR